MPCAGYKDFQDMMRETGAAVRAAREAGKILMSRFGRKLEVRDKGRGRRDLVTQADMESEGRIISLLKEAFPDYGILSEESGEEKAKGFREGITDVTGGGRVSQTRDLERPFKRCAFISCADAQDVSASPCKGRDADSPRGRGPWRWVIDPLDGTHNFAYGIPLFGVSIALEREGKLVLGVINLPYYKQLFVAERGKGSFLNGKRVRVSGRGVREAMVMFGGDSGNPDKGETAEVMRRLEERTFEVRRLGAAVFHHASVASGTADAYVDIGNKPWDNAAGFLLVEEAGGKATDFSGRPWSGNNTQVAVSNGKVHEEILRIVKKEN